MRDRRHFKDQLWSHFVSHPFLILHEPIQEVRESLLDVCHTSKEQFLIESQLPNFFLQSGHPGLRHLVDFSSREGSLAASEAVFSASLSEGSS